MFRWVCRAAMMLSGLAAAPAFGAAALQCVPYARIVSGVEIQGDALYWWDKAQDRYRRGQKPKKGAVLAFRPNGPMVFGHVAVVSKILDDRRILIRHANWSVPGAIEEDVLAIDVSEQGDWSAVRVWFSPNKQMGARTNPTFGFIYPAKGKLHKFTPDPTLGNSTRFASIDEDYWDEQDLPRQMLIAAPRALPERTPSRSLERNVVMIAQAGPNHAAPAIRRKPREADPFVVEYADASAARKPRGQRTLEDIIADVRDDATMR